MGCIVRRTSYFTKHVDHSCYCCKFEDGSLGESPCISCFPGVTGYPQNLKYCQFERKE